MSLFSALTDVNPLKYVIALASLLFAFWNFHYNQQSYLHYSQFPHHDHQHDYLSHHHTVFQKVISIIIANTTSIIWIIIMICFSHTISTIIIIAIINFNTNMNINTTIIIIIIIRFILATNFFLNITTSIIITSIITITITHFTIVAIISISIKNVNLL